jgi:hypothetical protein
MGLYIYIYIYIHTYTHTHIHPYTVYTHIHIHIHTQCPINDSVSIEDEIFSNDGDLVKQKGLLSVCGVIDELLRHLPGGSGGDHKTPEVRQSPVRGLKEA